MSADGVVGLVIGTRPDCMPDSLLDYLEEMKRHTFLLVEYGIESTDDKTLCRIDVYKRQVFWRVRDEREEPGSLKAICPSGPIPPMKRSMPP